MVVVREVSGRLADLGRHEAAAEVLRAADQPADAVAVAVAGGAWEKARESARGHGQLAEKVELRAAERRYLFVFTRAGSLYRWLVVVGSASDIRADAMRRYQSIMHIWIVYVVLRQAHPVNKHPAHYISMCRQP